MRQAALTQAVYSGKQQKSEAGLRATVSQLWLRLRPSRAARIVEKKAFALPKHSERNNQPCQEK
jgi:hypothetical protein